MKRAALYARVSRANGQQNPEMQLAELREHCQRRNWKIAGEYVDRMTGAREKRPALDRLLSDCRRRTVDAVVVTDMIGSAGAFANSPTLWTSSARSGSTSSACMREWTSAHQTDGLCSAFSLALPSLSAN